MLEVLEVLEVLQHLIRSFSSEDLSQFTRKSSQSSEVTEQNLVSNYTLGGSKNSLIMVHIINGQIRTNKEVDLKGFGRVWERKFHAKFSKFSKTSICCLVVLFQTWTSGVLLTDVRYTRSKFTPNQFSCLTYRFVLPSFGTTQHFGFWRNFDQPHSQSNCAIRFKKLEIIFKLFNFSSNNIVDEKYYLRIIAKFTWLLYENWEHGRYLNFK